MKGTWHGSFGPNATDRTPVTLVLDWDGDNVTGILNPGLRTSKVENATLDPAGWKFHMESNYKDRAGTVTRLVVDAHLEDVTNVRRKLVGTYTLGTQKGDINAMRDN